MNTHTLYLDCVALASAAYPSGLSYSLFTTLRGRPSQISTGLLAALLLPFVLVAPAVWALRPGLLPLHGTSLWMLGAAVLLVPVTFGLEYVIHGVAVWRSTGSFPLGFTVQSFWNCPLGVADHLLLALVAVGEEIFYRLIWIAVMLSFGLSMPLALVISSVAYGFNHLSFGGLSVFSKSVTGLCYGALYLLGGQSIILPVVTHVLQNFTLLRLTRERHA